MGSRREAHKVPLFLFPAFRSSEGRAEGRKYRDKYADSFASAVGIASKEFLFLFSREENG
jgi:hypothetical protein